ncbi:swarming motility protein SwrC [Marinithermofilum abyssi]|uniref:Swarming motility protein SwrC n=1 Tax=Marinithermofilum abyssi TaxID=1571185 RepID=A0A8J2VDC4_9BACL|nr:efflux RND transporter permease subunit [Marinithermofilum abyssi]GGE07768.1 swarming motility protein SwrC [Marinithermofilum abyssi]
MNFLTRFSLKNPVAILILSVLLIIAGTFSFQALKVDMLPDIEFPQISVQVVYPGASPQDVNEQVTSKLEKEFEKINGVKKMDSSSFDSSAVINMEFPFHTDMDKVEQDIQSKVEEAELPDDADVKINRFSFGTFPIYNISLFAKGDTDVQKVFEREIEPRLSKVPGVNSVSVGGTKEQAVKITLDKEKAAQKGVTLQQVKQAIENKAISFPAGSVKDGSIEVPVRVEEKLDTVDELKSLTVSGSSGAGQGTPGAPAPGEPGGAGAKGPGAPSGINGALGAQGGAAAAPASAGDVKLGEIAKVETASQQDDYTRFNGKTSLSVAVTKKQGANTVEVADKVIQVLKDYDDQVDYSIGFDQAKDIKKSVETLVREGLFGALFASLAVLLFLRNLRATIIAIISIPLSLLVAAIFLQRLDITLNIMTLGGMAVAVGRVVDDSIVVIENIFRRIRQGKGSENRDELAVESTREVLKAIVSSTITTAVVFLPLGFVGGITGEFFRPFAITVVVALFASLLVAVTVVPILGKFSFDKVGREHQEGWMQRAYARVIRSALNHKFLVVFTSLALLVGSMALVPSLGFTFLPNEQQKTIIGTVELPSATTLQKTNEVSRKIENVFENRKGIKSVTVGVGSRDFRTGLEKKNQGNYFISLNEGVDVDREIKTLDSEIKDVLKENHAKGVVSLQELKAGGPPTNNNVDIDLYSNNLDSLQTAAARVEKYMKTRDDVKDITNNLQEKQRQWVVQIDPEKASEAGVASSTVLGLVADQTKPVDVEDLKLDGKERNIRIIYDKPADSRQDLEDLRVPGKKGMIPLSSIADVKEAEKVTSIQKLNGKVYAQVSGQVKGDNTQQVTEAVIQGVKQQVDLPDDVSLDAGGGSEETEQTFKELGLAIIVAIGLVYLTMLVTFGKARIPFIILSSLLFVPVGAIGGLYIAGEPLSISAMIGVLMLIGIVTTNAIVLVDRVGQNQDKGMTLREALMEAGKTRLRPILMTAFATIAALLPLAFTTSSGTLISKGLAVVVIGGLTTSTLLTLVIIPVLYELFFLRRVKKEQVVQA